MGHTDLNRDRIRHAARALATSGIALPRHAPPSHFAWERAVEVVLAADREYCEALGLVVAEDRLHRTDMSMLIGFALPMLADEPDAHDRLAALLGRVGA